MPFWRLRIKREDRCTAMNPTHLVERSVIPRGLARGARLLAMRRGVRLAPFVPLVCSCVHFKNGAEFAVGNTNLGRVQRHRARDHLRQASRAIDIEWTKRTGGKRVGHTGRRAGRGRRMRARRWFNAFLATPNKGLPLLVRS
jgi:hypothetical protein